MTWLAIALGVKTALDYYIMLCTAVICSGGPDYVSFCSECWLWCPMELSVLSPFQHVFLNPTFLFSSCRPREELRLGDIFFCILNEHTCIFLIHHITLLSTWDLSNQNSSLLSWHLSRLICSPSTRCLFKCYSYLLLLRILASHLPAGFPSHLCVFCVKSLDKLFVFCLCVLPLTHVCLEYLK